MILIKVDGTLQTKYLSLKPLLKEQSMLDGNRPPYRMFIDLGYHGSQKKRIGSGKQGYTHVHTEKERERWRSWRYRGQAKDNNKSVFLEALGVLARLSVVLVFFLFLFFCSVIFMDAGIC